MALAIFYGHSPTSLKYALHHLSPGGIFLYLASISYITSLLSSVVLHHVSEIWMTSTSSRMMIDYIFEVGVASSHLYGHVHAVVNSWWHVLTSSKYWHHSFPHLQGFVGLSLHLQRLVGIFEILMSNYSAMHLDV